jgi:hypothetical protein
LLQHVDLGIFAANLVNVYPQNTAAIAFHSVRTVQMKPGGVVVVRCFTDLQRKIDGALVLFNL